MPDVSRLAPLIVPRPSEVTRIGGVATIRFPIALDAGPHRAHVEPVLRASGLGDDAIEWRAPGRSSGRPCFVRVSLDRSLAADGRNEQGYHLDVVQDEPSGQTGPSVRLRAASGAGLRHAAATLAQLLRQYGPPAGSGALPAMRVSDEPAFATRGVMLDISRDRVPTMEHLREIVNTLALLKCNHLQLYTEHTFAYAGHEEVWHKASPMTGAEYQTLDGWCRELGIVLAANQNCFGHLASWLKLPRYLPLAEIDGLEKVWKFLEWDRPGPFSLCPIDPRSHELVREMLDQLLPHFSSKLVNINCDETFDVGQGRSADAVAERGRAEVYFDFVHRVVGEVRRHGFKPMFWADIALSHPDKIGMMPSDLLALAWGYEPDSDFDQWGRTLKNAGREFWVSPGTSAWRSIIGRTVERRGNIDAAISAGKRHGATGVLMTDWGDLGHRQQWPISLHGIADGLNAAWSGEAGGIDPAAESLQVFRDGDLAIAMWLDDLGEIDKIQKQISGKPGPDGKPGRLKNASAVLRDSTLGWSDAWKPGSAGLWRESAGAAAWLSGKVPAGAGEIVREELAFSARCARVLCERAAARRDHRAPGDSELRDRLEEISQEHRRLWLVRSRPGGLEQSDSHYRRLIDEFGVGARG